MGPVGSVFPEVQTARQFPSGANRSDDSGKPNYVGYLSPIVIERFGRYMLAHQYGGLRSADNWKKGIPKQAYLESMLRHFLTLWFTHEVYGNKEFPKDCTNTVQEALCALLFNVQGYLHEELRDS